MSAASALRIVLQARTDSARLPAKSLLPLAGHPLAVLAARRLQTAGAEVVVATSDRSVDDELARLAAAAGLHVLRGSTDDVLGRFVEACADLDDDAVCIRATGDNPLPDGHLAARLVERLRASGARIAGVRWPHSQLPYGVSLEAFTVGSLRDADRTAQGSHDREHVTPALWRTGPGVTLDPREASGDSSGLRATVDTLDDYVGVLDLFRDVGDPLTVTMESLVARLAATTASRRPPRFRKGAPHHAFVLGTAQLGLDYGRGPEHLAPSATEASDIVRTAIQHGVTHLDTARAYGSSEKRVGRALRGGGDSRLDVATKLSPLDRLPAAADEATIRAFVDASVFESLEALRTSSSPMMMLHRPAHRTDRNGAIWKRLLEHRNEGRLSSLGVSVSTPDQLREAARDPDVARIQFPCHLLDPRWDDVLVDVTALRGDSLLLHARSALLQGLFVQTDATQWPRIEGADPDAILRYLAETASALGRASVADLCFAFLRAHPSVDGIVVGTPSLRSLRDSLTAFDSPPLTAEELSRVQRTRPPLPARLLDPAQWPPR